MTRLNIINCSSSFLRTYKLYHKDCKEETLFIPNGGATVQGEGRKDYRTGWSPGADPGFDQGGGPDRDRPKTAILGPQFCRILVLGPHFWWSGGGQGPPPGSAPGVLAQLLSCRLYNTIYYSSLSVSGFHCKGFEQSQDFMRFRFGGF